MLIATLVYLGFLASMPLKAKAATPPDGRMPSLGGRIAVSSHSLRLRYIASKPRNLHQRLDISERSRKRDPKKKKKKVLLRGAGQATFYYEKEGPGEEGTYQFIARAVRRLTVILQ